MSDAMTRIEASEPTRCDVGEIRTGLSRNGCVILHPFSVFEEVELCELNALCRKLPEEVVTLGDAGELNSLYVGRFMLDIAGERPTLVNRPHSDHLLQILNGKKVSGLFKSILGQSHYIRRCQVNRMLEGAFIGRHLDIDSNPDYVISVVVQLSRYFRGGEFMVYHDDERVISVASGYGTVTISCCDKPHEVMKVTAHERLSLVYFYGNSPDENRR
jgi:hypothetical protein